MKKWVMLLVVASLCTASNVQATVQIVDYLINDTFDVPWTGDDAGSSLYASMDSLPASTYGWKTAVAEGTGGGYYIDSYADVEDTPVSMAYMQLHSGVGDVRMWQDVGCDLVAGQTYQVAFKYRQFALGTDVRDPADLDVFWGMYDGSISDKVTIPKANLTSAWQVCNYSFTYDGSRGATIPAYTWVLAFRVTNGTSGVPSGATIDSLSVIPEPCSMALLAIGGFLLRRRS